MSDPPPEPPPECPQGQHWDTELEQCIIDMTLQTPIDAENIVYDFLASKYDAYRSNLSDKSKLPTHDEIIWGSPVSEIKAYSFMVNLVQISRDMPYIGQRIQNYNAAVVARFAARSITKTTKPDFIKYFQEFIDYTITTNQTNTYFTSRGIKYVAASSSGIVEPRSSEDDVWLLNFQIRVNYVRSF